VINHSIHSLEDINHELTHALELAAIDYSMANVILKNHFFDRSADSSNTPIRGDEWKVQTLLSSLQYMDIFTQRVNHLIAIHGRISKQGLPGDLKNPFYHLLAFHTLTITTDLVKSIAAIRGALGDLKDSNVVRLAWPGEIFANAMRVRELLQSLTTVFLNAAGTSRRLPNPPLSDEQITFLNSIYTTESERLVLKWFLQSMPGGTWQDLIPWYVHESDKPEENSIELF
jgi:hypothetical protein